MGRFIIQTKSARWRRFAVENHVLTQSCFGISIDERSLGTIEAGQISQALVANDLRRTIFEHREHQVTASGLVLVRKTKDVRLQNLAIGEPGLQGCKSVCIGGKQGRMGGS